MTKDEAIKRYERFLKDTGVYRRAILIHTKENAFHKRYPEMLNDTPMTWISASNVFCDWGNTLERDVFWWGVSLLWIYECCENEIFIPQPIYKLNRLKQSLLFDMKRYLPYNKDEGRRRRSSIEGQTFDRLKEKIEEKIHIYEKNLKNE